MKDHKEVLTEQNEKNTQEPESKRRRSFRGEETSLLPKIPEDIPEEDHPVSDDSGRLPRHSMPQVDFGSFEQSQENGEEPFPQLSALDPQNEESDYSSRFTPIPDRLEKTEEEAIEEAFQQTADKPRKHSPDFFSTHRKSVIFSLLGIFLAVVLVIGGITLYEYYSDPFDHLILPGVSALGSDLGGMNVVQAEEAISAAAERSLLHEDMEVHLPGKTLVLTPAATKIRLDAKGLARAAYNLGRKGTPEEVTAARQCNVPIQLDLLPYLRADLHYIRLQLQGYADAYNTDYIPSSYALEGEQPPLDLKNYNEKNTPQSLLLLMGSPGFYLDVENTADEILKAYSKLNMAPHFSLQPGDQEPAPLDLSTIHEEYTIDPIDSSMDSKTFEIISGSYGYSFDLSLAQRLLSNAHYGETVRVPMEYVAPEIMDDEVYFQDVLSVAETKHGNNPNRNHNLMLACQALDGLILNPGDEFSYNETLGQRTAEKGYKGAPAYSGTALVDSLGGGICQVSSTLYYACLQADLEITDRINHGFLPTYIDPGMDATVSWGRPDYKFRNSSSFPIQLKAQTTEDKVIIQILGTDDRDYYVKMEYEMSDVYLEDVYREYPPDAGYHDGEIVDGGSVGHHVTTYRCKYSKETDELLSRELEAQSSYIAQPQIIAVVRKPQKPDAAESPETEVPETEAPETQAPETQPPATDPPVTDPPMTEPAETQPVPADPPETDLPETQPAAPEVPELPGEDNSAPDAPQEP